MKRNTSMNHVFDNKLDLGLDIDAFVASLLKNDTNEENNNNNDSATIELDAHNAEDYFKLGLGYLLTNQYQLAINNFNNAIELDDQNAEVYFKLGLAYRLTNQTNQKQLAIDSFIRAGNICLDKNSPYDAIICFKNTIELDDQNAEVYFKLGLAYRLTNQKQLAIDSFNNAIKLDDQNAEVYFKLSLAYLLTNLIYAHIFE
jgi:tetratricopeptide (TPR) repeat protein